MNKARTTNIIKKTFEIIAIILALFISLIAINRIFQKLILKNVYPTFFGYGSATIATSSMYPELKTGNFIITKSQKDYSVGETITFFDQKSTTTHKIIEDYGESVKTKGVNNDSADVGVVKKSDICGKVIIVIPFLGYIIGFIRTPLGIFSLALIAGSVWLTIVSIKKMTTQYKSNEDTKEKEHLV